MVHGTPPQTPHLKPPQRKLTECNFYVFLQLSPELQMLFCAMHITCLILPQ